MNASLASNNRAIADSFEAPEWYLTRFAANIRVRAETVEVLAEGLSVDRILDIGCGDGSLSRALLPRAREITFLDPSAAMLQRAALSVGKGQAPATRFVNSGLMEADLPSEHFDLVLCLGVLAYVSDPAPFLARVRSSLKPGGRLILECTDANHPLSFLERKYQALTASMRPGRFATHPHVSGDTTRAAERQGLRLESVFRYAYGLPVLSRLISQRVLYRIIRRIYGTAVENRRSRLGNQLILRFQRPRVVSE